MSDLLERLRDVYGNLTPGAIERADLDGMAFTVKEVMEEIERNLAILKRHHDWHLAQDEEADGSGGAEAYAESELCSETVVALGGRA